MPADHAWLETAAPFDASQLVVQVVADISMRYADRRVHLGRDAKAVK